MFKIKRFLLLTFTGLERGRVSCFWTDCFVILETCFWTGCSAVLVTDTPYLTASSLTECCRSPSLDNRSCCRLTRDRSDVSVACCKQNKHNLLGLSQKQTVTRVEKITSVKARSHCIFLLQRQLGLIFFKNYL